MVDIRGCRGAGERASRYQAVKASRSSFGSRRWRRGERAFGRAELEKARPSPNPSFSKIPSICSVRVRRYIDKTSLYLLKSRAKKERKRERKGRERRLSHSPVVRVKFLRNLLQLPLPLLFFSSSTQQGETLLLSFWSLYTPLL